MSETGLTPRSPMHDVINVRDISEVISEVVTEEETEEEENESQDLSDQIITKAEQQKSLSKVEENAFQFQKAESKSSESEKVKIQKNKEKEDNPFHFNKSKIRSFEQSDSEPKKSEIKNGVSISNKRRNEILESRSNSIAEKEKVQMSQNEILENSDSSTLKEELEKKRPRKKWQKESQPIKIKTKQIQQDSSFESSCYYCRNICEKHQNMITPECKPASERNYKQMENKKTSEIGVQVGKSTMHHYLFDPTQDAIFETNPFPNYMRATGLGSNAAANSIIDLMKRQLQLTESHMRSQKELYREYCTALEKTQAKTQNLGTKERVLFGRSERPKKLSFEDALKMVKEEMAQQEQEIQLISKSVISSTKSRKESRKSKKRSKSSSKNETIKTSESNSNRNKKTNEDKSDVSSTINSIEEEIENDEYEMEFDSESEVNTETSISTEDPSDS